MANENVIINRVAQSGIITFNLETLYPTAEVVSFDIKDFLFKELLLKEKDFRKALKEHDWTVYAGKNVAIFCSTNAIVPVWAYMLIMTYLEPIANKAIFGTKDMLMTLLFQEALANIPVADYKDKRVVIKGCGNLPIPISAYVEITRLLKPVVKSLMYGEPCSTVPIYKQKNLRIRRK